LVVSLKQPGQGFTVIAFQPADIEVEVQDNCGHPVDLGSGTTPSVFFISGISDPILHPASVGKGLYRGIWTPTNVSRNVAQTTVTLQAVAQTLAYPQAGSTPLVTGTVTLQVKDPTLIRNIANSASYAPEGQVAPCGWVAIFGENLADSQTPATDLPLGPTLAGTSAMLGGKLLPLIYVDNTQINAQIPCGLQPNTEHDLQVIHKSAQSVTSHVVVAETQPAVFTVNQAGFGQGAIFGVAPDGSRFLADRNHPVHAGDTVEIYCTGLGAVSPAVTEGNPSPGSPPLPAVTQDVNVLIGGVSAELSFKGLTPGAVGLYQVNAVIPAGLPAGYSDLPIVITVGSHESQPGVTLGVNGGRAN
jgi:uncharacterized protein (TIGR03437 family)